MAKPIEMPFELWTRVGRRKHVLHGDTYAPPDEHDWTAVCGGDAALCQITL